MATITPAQTTPVPSSFQTTPAYSGTFIPTLWAAKMLVKFYKNTIFSEIANTDYEGEVSKLGDKVIINTVPTITIKNYPEATGNPVQYEVPTPSTVELPVDQAKYFAFQVNDILAYQSKANLMDTFSDDAAKQMKIAIDSAVLYRMLTELAASSAATANMGATAGAVTGGYNLGTDSTPVTINTPDDVLNLIVNMMSVLDEQNVPEDGRYIIIDPKTKGQLLQSRLAQVQFSGDSTSAIRTGKIGMLSNTPVYVSNNLPTGAAAQTWRSGDGSEGGTAGAGTEVARRAIFVGHKSAMAFVSQITKVEPVRNPNDFGDYVRGLNVYGAKLIKPEALSVAIVPK